MKICIAGATGFIGTPLSQFLLDQGHIITALGRSPSHPMEGTEHFTYISADTSKEGDWQKRLSEVNAIVNLAGVNILRYWTDKAKLQIYNSRIQTTRNIVQTMSADTDQILINASAVGYYGDRSDEILNENSTHGSDFLAKVCVAWEKEAFKAADKHARVVVVRFGLVFGQNGGPLQKMILPFKLFAGGPMGSGSQWLSWVHIEDLMSAIIFALEMSSINGTFNLCAPNPVRNRELAKMMGRILHRPSFFSVPSFVIKVFMGEMGKSLLQSQKALPENLLRHGFEFKYAHLQDALEAVLA